MAIGGKRTGAGRKSQWRSPTKMLRLPEKYEAEIIEYAKLLDSEAQSPALALRDQVQLQVNQVLMTLKPSDRAVAKRLFNKLLVRLDGLELAGWTAPFSDRQIQLSLEVGVVKAAKECRVGPRVSDP